MSLNVGELAFYLTLDDTQFNAKISRAGGLVDSLGQKATVAGKQVAAGFTLGVGAVTTMGVALTKVGANYNILQQNSRAALKTVLGSTEAVNNQMAKLDALTTRSPFSKSVFIEGQQQLLAFGMAAEKVVPTLDAIQNAVAASGGNSQKLAEITFVLAQIQAAGKITGQDLIQLGQRGIDAATLIGSQMGKTGAQIRKDITNGALGADQAIDALTKGMAAKFGGATDLIKEQWTGASDRIKAAWRDNGAILAKPFIDPNGGGQAVVWGNLVADVMRQVQKHVETGVNAIDHRAQPVFNMVTKTLQQAAAQVARFNMHGLLSQMDALGKYTPLIAGVSGALFTMGSANIPILGRFAGGLNPVVVGLAALAATSPELREVGSAFASSLGPAIPFLENAGKAAADLAMELIHEMSPGLVAAADGAGEFLANIAPIVPKLVDLVSVGAPVVGMIADLAGHVANLPTPLLAAAAAAVAFHGPLSKTRGIIMQASSETANIVGSLTDFWRASKAVAAEAGPGVSTAMTATRAAASGLSSALAGLINPANLVGLGLTALTAIVAAYVAKKAEAKKAAQEFASTLDEETGAVTENSRAWVAKRLEEEGLLETAQKAGVSTKELTDRLLEGGDAYKQYRERLSEAHLAMTEAAVASALETEEHQRQREALGALIYELSDLAPAMDEGREAAQRLAQAEGEAADSTERHQQAVDALIDAQQKQAAANGDLVAAQYATKDAMVALSEVASAQGELARSAAGGVDLMADSNRATVEATMEAVNAINRQMDALIKTGATQDQVNAKFTELTDGLYAQLAAFGVTGKEAEAFAASLGLIPTHKSVVVDMTVDDEAARVDIDALINDTKDAQGTITIKADNVPALDELASTLGLIRTSEGTFALNANDDPALAQLLATIAQVDASKGVFTIDGNNQEAMSALNEALRQVNAGQGTISINGVDYATQVADNIVRTINGKVAYIRINGQNVANGYQGGITFADGGIVHSYASGGFENHVAQIAPAGAWRVWAEPETGGEAYVPLAASKRRRSQQIMAEVARTFGDLYIPASASRYADGAAPTASSMSSGPSDILVRVTVTNPFTAEEVEETVRGEIVSVLRQVG